MKFRIIEKKEEIKITKDLVVALKDLINKQNRRTNPWGEFDKAGRFYLDDAEEQKCCFSVSSPTKRFPYSLMKHARSAEHIANKHNVPKIDLVRMYNKYKKDPDMFNLYFEMFNIK